METVFVISSLLLMYAFLRIKKTDKKINGILWILMIIILFMCYNSILFYLLSVINIKATLIIRSVFNIILTLAMLIIFRKRQKYYFEKRDLVMMLIISYVSLVLFLYRFGIDFNVKFEMDDAAKHFAFSKMLALNNTFNSGNNVIYNMPNTWLFFSYVNCATLMQILLPFTGMLGIYKSFILFEMGSFLLSGILLYFIIKNNKVSILNYIVTIIIIVLYILGYPLTNLLYGFHYWGIVIILIETIILMVLEFDNYHLYDSNYMVLIFLLLMIAIFTAYYLYVPVVYMAVGLYYIYLWKVRKITFKRMSIYIVITLLIPFIFGVSYYNIFGEYFNKTTGTLNMEIAGENYVNLLGNFIFILPLVIYGLIHDIKKHKIDFITILTILSFIYIIILFILCIKGIMSNYYYGKLYNLLWLMVFIYIIKILYNDKEVLSKVYIYSYIVISLLACFRIETLYNSFISTNSVISNLGDIYDNNVAILLDSQVYVNKDIYELLVKVYDNQEEYKNDYDELLFITSYFRKLWISQIIDIVPCRNYTKAPDTTNNIWWVNVMKVNQIAEIDHDNNIKYFVWLINKNDDLDISKYEVIYKNNSGYILKKK